MNFNTILPGMKDVQITSIEEKEMGMVVHVQMLPQHLTQNHFYKPIVHFFEKQINIF